MPQRKCHTVDRNAGADAKKTIEPQDTFTRGLTASVEESLSVNAFLEKIAKLVLVSAGILAGFAVIIAAGGLEGTSPHDAPWGTMKCQGKGDYSRDSSCSRPRPISSVLH